MCLAAGVARAPLAAMGRGALPVLNGDGMAVVSGLIATSGQGSLAG